MRPSFNVLPLVLLLALTSSGQSKLPSITGRITELAGNPLEGATVEISTAAGERIWHGVTGATGEFGIENLRQGKYAVEVSARGFHKERRIAILKEADKLRIDVGLIVGELSYVRPIAVSGVVRDYNGKLLSAATLTARAVLNSRVTTTAKTDAHGHYSFSISKPGQYEIVVLSNGRSVTVLASLGEPWTNQTLDISLYQFLD